TRTQHTSPTRSSTDLYKNAKELLRKAQRELDRMKEIKPQNCPDYFHEFSLTNNRHLQYLIYDYLKLPDITPKFKPGKKRAVSKDVLEVYMEDHRSEEHTSELQSRENLVCRLLLEKKNIPIT